MKSKKFIIVFLPAVLVVGGIAYYWQPVENQDESVEANAGIETEKAAVADAQEQAGSTQEASAAAAAASNESKLAQIPGFGHAIEDDEARFSEEEITREQMISQCMQEQGFDYTPAPSVVLDDAAASSPEEFERLLMEAANDPNERYVSTLSADMRSAYYMALTGMEDPNDPEGEAHDIAAYNDSCVRRAFEEIPGVYAKRNLLSQEFDALNQKVEQDERIIQATAAWSECMNDIGYRFTAPNDVHRHADQTMAGVFEQRATEDEIKRAEEALSRTLESTDQCIEKSKLTAIRQRVRVEYENRFFDKHRELLTDGERLSQNLGP